jgi:tRNA pseudouridine55 synthase
VTPSGVLLFDKPAGISSHDAVAQTRRRLGRGVKVGHAGTLDPFATGLLLILVGRATRVQRFLMQLPKTYEATARFGAVSTTGDPEGEISFTGVLPSGELGLPTGRLRQRPPAYSAVKIAGRRAYALARAGVDVELPEREVTVYRFEERWREPERRGFRIECSAGTYVRSLIAALGDAYCEALRRTRIGPFDVGDADPERIVPLDAALSFLPEVRLEPDAARRAGHGQIVAVAAGSGDRLSNAAGDAAASAAQGSRVIAAGDTPPSAAASAPAIVAGDAPASAAASAPAIVAGDAPASAAGSPPIVRLTDDQGLIALAELTERAGLKPVVGLDTR